MAGIRFVSQVLNQREAPALYEDLRSKLPAPGFRGRIFFATDGTVGDTIYRDTGTLWEVLASNNPTVTGVTNGLSLFGNDVGLGGTLVQNTQINCDTYLIKFDNYGQFGIGNTNEPSMLFDTNNGKINTYYNGSIRGFDFDFVNNIYQFGDLLFNVNGTAFIINDASQLIYTTNGGVSRGLELELNNGFYKLGDYNFTVNGTYIEIDDGNVTIQTRFNNLKGGIQLDYSNSYFSIGDYNNQLNGTFFAVNDGSQTLVASTNLAVGGTYTNSAFHLKIYIGGNQYYIQLQQ